MLPLRSPVGQYSARVAFVLMAEPNQTKSRCDRHDVMEAPAGTLFCRCVLLCYKLLHRTLSILVAQNAKDDFSAWTKLLAC